MTAGLIYARVLAIIFTIVGFFGFFAVGVPYVVQLDLWQSLIYLVLAACGWYIGWFYHDHKKIRHYNETATAVLMVLLLFGLVWPNWGDILHLEEEENIFHAVLFVWGVITSALTPKTPV
ncbi:TPA: hypothetical protein DIC39_00005 [Patescibacteria group bacterium]|nr:hypothetical protein [Patescibacteria group bacterium]HCU47438.1 hypothetical protein [Patescibacteria group bacterium]